MGTHRFRNLLPMPRRHARRKPSKPTEQGAAGSQTATTVDDRSQFSGQFGELFPGGKAIVFRNDGTEIDLVDLVIRQNAPVLLGWLRHYGCTLCKKQAADWMMMRKKLEERGCFAVRMILVGNGYPNQAEAFSKEMGWQEEIVSDPRRDTYKALDFRKGVKCTLTRASLKKSIESFREGHPQTWSRIPTDALQQGGAIIVDSKGAVRLFHRDAYAGDHAELEQLINAIVEISPSWGAEYGRQFADMFPENRAIVYRNDGTQVDLIELIEAQHAPVLLGWLRHYGCTLCKKQTADWRAMRRKLEEKGCNSIRMILVGNGYPHQAAAFTKEMDWQEEIVSDPKRETYKAFDFRKGVKCTLTSASLKKSIESFREGHAQTWSRIPTDALQQGGAVLVDLGGAIRLLHRDEFAGDHAEIDNLVDAICHVCTP